MQHQNKAPYNNFSVGTERRKYKNTMRNMLHPNTLQLVYSSSSSFPNLCNGVLRYPK